MGNHQLLICLLVKNTANIISIIALFSFDESSESPGISLSVIRRDPIFGFDFGFPKLEIALL